MSESPLPSVEAVTAALATVKDPEIHRPITELGMVDDVAVALDGSVEVKILLTTAGCPLRDRITNDVTNAVQTVPGVTSVKVALDVMSDEQKQALRSHLQGGRPQREISFAQAGSLTRVYAIASGKGGVGKSSTTANLAAAMAQQGFTVGIVDADVYGHSMPRMFGIETPPSIVDGMIVPPEAYGVRVVSPGMFVEGNRPIAWRGPMLHRALEQLLADVFWGDLDILLLDLPPGTGDIAISTAQLLPGAEVVIVTTPQLAAHEVAERAGAIATQTRQRLAGVIENMAGFACPHCGELIDVFGSGGGQAVAETLTKLIGADVPLLGSVPIEPIVREGGDLGKPVVLSHPESAAAKVFTEIAAGLAGKARGLAGRPLTLTPV
ncbi:MAG TPA: Mrp/NBP35 family ATP-binding protein [Mycobacteriales bacterium]|jgi:ATP-binding protein involved in chromosome partitioning|nr:Mrp/NBP35 family ATP-binding protein [Mycobacteriales bacterium]HVX69150.1 Mrp/NBP35 family ATP-binding protein [Mycobacteriales bacterium]